ncbi:ASKHA domain-containing protein [Carboxydothermus hydrogenoformans]|uniref:Iron-sulfur cluster binding protein n=3 Tax=Carboxydothermus hydrogenoformans TaxID=129958 RepID=Q3ACS2_CARHZ|nr:ASKHA domain-containing protein [Carboxydothermus hydrogenoformans]ABB15463.1 iron-sulfur cluster binding protein [Carboxydothermus hydrogenoformans Z-2901]3ZYY_X Chain X, Iron-sulfur Cluster Binding Protein [Carboxydothermus hydrogenoformans]3ZYY_Y Chain Y, Iron-sulfur Cluster Binding Protein [Carboxydothermus hydrogenoformans]
MAEYKVLFKPDQKEVAISENTNLMEALNLAGINIKTVCGGAGTCGKCLVRVVDGQKRVESYGKLKQEEIAQGYVLACQTYPESDLIIEIPFDSRLTQHQIVTDDEKASGVMNELDLAEEDELDPLFKEVSLELPVPTLDDPRDDLSRLTATFSRQENGNLIVEYEQLKDLPQILRNENFSVTVGVSDYLGLNKALYIKSGSASQRVFGLAIDIGTTTVVVQLVDLVSGKVLGTKGNYNKQAAFGDDVISRIIYVDENPDGAEKLRKAVLSTINELIFQLCKEHGVEKKEIMAAVVAGNTTMTHLFLEIDPRYIRLEPYTPAALFIPPVPATEAKIEMNPKGFVYIMPNVASYVGGDITSGVLYTGLANSDEITLFIDIGTNGEMVLGNKDWLVTCACSAGPAFEGSGIKHGMRAMQGAIERVSISEAGLKVKYQTVGGIPPVGICGSGLIDLLANLKRAGIIDRSGKIDRTVNKERIREGEDGLEFVLAWANESGNNKDIVITEADIQNLIRAKAAIFAGVRTMLAMVDLPLEAIDRVIIAGGFGKYLNIKDAITIGLLPDIDINKFSYVGNSSLKGARKALLSRKACAEVKEIARKMTYLELSVGTTFMDEFVSASFIPHTDLHLFPSVE